MILGNLLKTQAKHISVSSLKSLPVQKQIPSNSRLFQKPVRMFSADQAKPEEKETKGEFTKEEIEKGRAEWGIKYSDEALKFEKEWKLIADKIEKE